MNIQNQQAFYRQERMVDRFQAKVEAQGRGDLNLADWQVLDRNSAKVLLSYCTQLPPPTTAMVCQWVIGANQGKLMPHAETIRYHQEGGVSLVCSALRPTRPYEDRKSMLALAGLQYVDQEQNTMWEVQSSGDKKWLAMNDQCDMSTLLAKRKAAMASRATTITLAGLSQGSVLDCQVGDRISFWGNNASQDGLVVADLGSSYRISTSNGTMVAAKETVTNILQAGDMTTAATKKELIDYFTEAYGDVNYARKLVEGGLQALPHSVTSATETPTKPGIFMRPADQDPQAQPSILTTHTTKTPKITLKTKALPENKSTTVTLMREGVVEPNRKVVLDRGSKTHHRKG